MSPQILTASLEGQEDSGEISLLILPNSRAATYTKHQWGGGIPISQSPVR